MIDPVSRFMHRSAGRHGPVMLMYHSVEPGNGRPRWPWAVSMQRFREQLDFLLAEGYATPPMWEVATRPERYSSRTAVVTFDDGYADNLSAFEELMKRGMHATWFVVSGSLGAAPAWPSDGRPAGRLLNLAELRSMRAAGMEIGSHAASHIRLTEADDSRLRAELVGSKATLEDGLDGEVTSFAYPYGACDARCAGAVRAAGYRAACTTRSGWALRDGDPYQLRRLTIFNTDTASSLARKLSIGDNDVSWPAMARYGFHRAASRIGK